MKKQIESIGIVGGGTAGFVTALILSKRFPNIKFEMIRSSKIGIIGVGEGSTEHWQEFMSYIGVKFSTVIRECDATFKSGIMFKGWHDEDYLHSIGPENEIKNGQYHAAYGKLITDGAPNQAFNPILTWKNKVFLDRLAPDALPPYNQYHFNTHKLNEFLIKVAELKGIQIIDDEISDVILDESGAIDYIVGGSTNYKADFYIDSTGFERLLIDKLGAKWNSYSQYLKMKAAIVFPLEEKEEYNMWTTAQAMDYGWMFNIPVWGRSGNGYIFDSDYITPEQAKDEVEKFLGRKVEIGKHLKFDPGALDRVWIKNCCAVGLSASFVEPLEATSIGTSIQQAFLLMHRLPNYDEITIENYNKDITDLLINIRDFVILHYVTNKRNTEFWKDVANIELPPELTNNLKKWRKNLPIADDFAGSTAYIMFKDSHYLQVLQGLRLFDREKITYEYQLQHPEIHKMAEEFIREVRTLEIINPSIGHKEFISRVRSM